MLQKPHFGQNVHQNSLWRRPQCISGLWHPLSGNIANNENYRVEKYQLTELQATHTHTHTGLLIQPHLHTCAVQIPAIANKSKTGTLQRRRCETTPVPTLHSLESSSENTHICKCIKRDPSIHLLLALVSISGGSGTYPRQHRTQGWNLDGMPIHQSAANTHTHTMSRAHDVPTQTYTPIQRHVKTDADWWTFNRKEKFTNVIFREESLTCTLFQTILKWGIPIPCLRK